MSNYNKATNFSVKDTLTSGDPDKVVSGAEIDNEFDAISSAVGSKADKVTSATSGNVPTLTASGNLQDSGVGRNVLSPTGAVTAFAADSAPSGWLECDGREVGRSTYPDLFNVIGTTFGSGDGSTTFGLPDLRGEFVRGWDNNRGADSGRNFGSNQDWAIENITGSFQPIEDVNSDFSGVFFENDEFTDGGVQSGNGGQNVGFDASRVVKTSNETRPRNIALMYIIKT